MIKALASGGARVHHDVVIDTHTRTHTRNIITRKIFSVVDALLTNHRHITEIFGDTLPV